MGNWRNRPPRRYFHRQRAPKSPPEYDKDPSSSGFYEDGIPLWEKKFCTLIGSVPWQKIVHAKKYVYSNNVLNWDDSAGKEAFQNAKTRFWAEINGFPCDISLPDPDTYIDDINWNSDIDPKMVKDLESVYFAQDGGENNGKFEHKHKRTKNLTDFDSKGCNEISEIINNPWECNSHIQDSGSLKNNGQGWRQWDNCNNDLKNTCKDDNHWERSSTQGDEVVKDKVQCWNQWENNNKDSKKLSYDNNPWEQSCTQGDEAVKNNAGGNCGNKFGGWDQGVNNVNQCRNWDNGGTSWERNCQGVYPVTTNEGWGEIGNNSWCWSQQKSWKLDCGDNPWEHHSAQSGRPPKDRGWRDCGGSAWSWKQWDNYSNEPKQLEGGRGGGGQGAWNKDCRKRGGSHLTSYKGYGYQQDYQQTGHCWRSKNSKKRVQFCT